MCMYTHPVYGDTSFQTLVLIELIVIVFIYLCIPDLGEHITAC